MNIESTPGAKHVTKHDLLTAGQASRLLEVSPSYLARLARDKRVAYETTPYGRTFRRAEIERLQRERSAGTAV